MPWNSQYWSYHLPDYLPAFLARDFIWIWTDSRRAVLAMAKDNTVIDITEESPLLGEDSRSSRDSEASNGEGAEKPKSILGVLSVLLIGENCCDPHIYTPDCAKVSSSRMPTPRWYSPHTARSRPNSTASITRAGS